MRARPLPPAAPARALRRRPVAGCHRHRLTREGPPRGRYVAPRLVEAVTHALERDEQALLFLNRRGYAPLDVCRACGFRFSCPNCDAWLVDHRFRRATASAIIADLRRRRPPACPKCQAADSFVACGPGVERLKEEAAALFPGARVLVLSSDLIASCRTHARRTRGHRRRPQSTSSSAPSLSPKAIIFRGSTWSASSMPISGLATAIRAPPNAPSSCCIRSPAAPGGETGRGQGFLQTHQPHHPVMQALIAGDREAFYASEIAARERTHYPPFGRLASLVVSGPDRPSAEGFARRLAAAAARCRGRSGERIWARPRRRLRWCAGATAFACWSRRHARSISRFGCAAGSRRRPSPKAPSGSRSISIQSVFCERRPDLFWRIPVPCDCPAARGAVNRSACSLETAAFRR